MALIMEIDLAILVQSNVLKKSVSLDCMIDIRLGFAIKVDDLGIAAAFKVEDAVVIPAVLIIADKSLFGSVESVVLPVPESPKKIAVFLPFRSVLAEECMEAMPLSGR
jgi:hypothetical protein